MPILNNNIIIAAQFRIRHDAIRVTSSARGRARMEVVSATRERMTAAAAAPWTTTTGRYCLGGERSHYLWAARWLRGWGGAVTVVVVVVARRRRGAGGGDATQWKGLFITIKFSLLFVVVRLVVSSAVACHIFYLRRRQTSCGGPATQTLRGALPWISTGGECRR